MDQMKNVGTKEVKNHHRHIHLDAMQEQSSRECLRALLWIKRSSHAAWSSIVHLGIKGELNLDKKWQSDYYLVLYNNERNSLSFQAMLSNFKDIVIYFQNLLTFNYRQISQWYFNSVIYGDGCVCKQHQSVNKNGRFLRNYDYIPRSIMWKAEERHILPSGCISAP